MMDHFETSGKKGAGHGEGFGVKITFGVFVEEDGGTGREFIILVVEKQ